MAVQPSLHLDKGATSLALDNALDAKTRNVGPL
jgi:hypothetical protein